MKNMNKFTMFIWGTIIFFLWAVILFIGYKKQDRTYIKLTNNIQNASIQYIKNNSIDLKLNESVKIYIVDLYKDELLKKDKNIEKYCIDSIVVSKDIFKYNYIINKECKE